MNGNLLIPVASVASRSVSAAHPEGGANPDDGVIKAIIIDHVRVVLLSFAMFFASATSALTADLNNPRDLIVTEDQTVELAPGTHQFREFRVDRNGTVVITGSTSIMTAKATSENGARIVYKRGSTKGDKVFTFQAIDASGVRSLKVEGNGANGTDASQTRAQVGLSGGNAKSRFIKGRWYEVPYWKSESSSAGGGGATAVAAGNAGEHAVDITLYLPGLKPNAEIVVEAVGGNGGRGQPGGNGGPGGNASNLHTASKGGPGGHGAPGGRGGDAGKISVYLIPAGEEDIERYEILNWIEVKPVSVAGIGGEGGARGIGGNPGNGSPWVPGNVNSPWKGQDGNPGANGSDGSGPKAGENNPNWVVVDVMDRDVYQQYMVQVLSIAMGEAQQ